VAGGDDIDRLERQLDRILARYAGGHRLRRVNLMLLLLTLGLVVLAFLALVALLWVMGPSNLGDCASRGNCM